MQPARMQPTVHATALVLATGAGPRGLLLTGEAGSGKSTLALMLLEAWAARGRFAMLVADDRVALEAVSGRLVARAPGALAGLIELRGLGIRRRDYLTKARIHRHAELGAAPERLPEPRVATFEGVAVPSLALPDAARGFVTIEAWLQEGT